MSKFIERLAPSACAERYAGALRKIDRIFKRVPILGPITRAANDKRGAVLALLTGIDYRTGQNVENRQSRAKLASELLLDSLEEGGTATIDAILIFGLKGTGNPADIKRLLPGILRKLAQEDGEQQLVRLLLSGIKTARYEIKDGKDAGALEGVIRIFEEALSEGETRERFLKEIKGNREWKKFQGKIREREGATRIIRRLLENK